MSQKLPSFFFFFNDTATTEIYTLSLHDALPISDPAKDGTNFVLHDKPQKEWLAGDEAVIYPAFRVTRSEEHTSELQSQSNIVCRLLLEKKKNRHTLRPLRFPLLVPTLRQMLAAA